MTRMIRYEWKKNMEQPLTQISVIGCSLSSIFCVYSSITQIEAADPDGRTVRGMDAAQVMKDTQQRVTLTQDRVDEIAAQYLAYTKDPSTSSGSETYHYLSEETYNTFYQPNRDLLSLITNVYEDPGSSQNMKTVLEENFGRNFMQAQLERDISTFIYWKSTADSRRSSLLGRRSEEIPEYQYGYRKGWDMILDTLTWPVLLMMIVCIGIAPVLFGEYQSRCDSLLLCMKYGKSN